MRKISTLFCVVASIIFLVYNLVVFNYSQKILLNQKQNLLVYLPVALVNYALIVIFYFYHLNEFYFTIGYFVVLAIEFRIYFNTSIQKNIFGTVCFALNIVCIRMLVMSIYSAYHHVDVNSVVTSVSLNLLCSVISISLAIVYITIFDLFVKIEILFFIHTIGDNATFVDRVLCSIYVYLIIIVNLYYIQDPAANSILHWYLIKVAVCSIGGFAVSIGYAIVMATLQDLQQQSEEVIEEIINTEEAHKELLDIAYIDSLTGCFKRDWAMQNLQQRIDENQDFLVIFIDLDGLKFVNDNYGHQEGDLYLLIVVKLIKEFFPNKAVCRLGGDEFLVIFEGKDYKACHAVTQALWDELNSLSQTSGEYMMSFSYGITTYEEGMSCASLLNNADKKMYDFKMANKKARN